MIKLKGPFNYKGSLLEAGTVMVLDADLEKVMIENDAAEAYEPKETEQATADVELDLSKLDKKELLEHATMLGIEGLTQKMANGEIIARIEEYGKV